MDPRGMSRAQADHPASLPGISLMIPAYNEAERLATSLQTIAGYVATNPGRWELIVVDDGSTDQTVGVAKAFAREHPELPTRVLENHHNRGKGFAVRRGLLAAQHPILAFTDADLSASIDEAPHILAPILAGRADVVVGSRALDRSRIEIPQALPRDLLGRGFNVAVRLLTGLPIHDTQCGFKAMRREVVWPLIAALCTDGFGFDVELLALCQAAGLRILEVPVRWSHHPGSKVHVLRDGAQMLFDSARVAWRLKRGEYRQAIFEAASRRGTPGFASKGVSGVQGPATGGQGE